MRPEDLYGETNALARHYRRFRVDRRLLLTGHSHQAWPDVGFEAQQQAWLDAAELVDDKWGRAFEVADRVRAGFARLLTDPDGDYALGASTHELVVRFLSSLPLMERPRLVTTDGEFHTLRRQLGRLAEEGIEVVEVAARPEASVAGRLAAAVDDSTAAVLTSCVFFETARIARGLGEAMEACRRHGAELLVDAYHALNVVPFTLSEEGLEDAYVVGGGYKYCQLGEGNCFLRIPPGREDRPVITGWFSEFGELESGGSSRDDRDRDPPDPPTKRAHDSAGSADARHSVKIRYGSGPARYAGATYDPTSHYRAAAVFDFFEERGLTPELLREVSQHQVGLLARAFDDLDVDPSIADRDRSVPLEEIGGFLVLRCPRAGEIRARLRERGVRTDHRGDRLRLGPAPYLTDRQLTDAVGKVGEVLGEI